MDPRTHDHTSFEGRGKPVFSVSVIILVLASVFVFLRFVSRGAIVKKLGVDDYFMFLAWLLAFGLTFSVCWGTRYGLGRHDDRVPSEWEVTLKKANYAFSVLYNPTLMATKTSILTFYLTISQTRRTFKWATIATLVVVNAGGLAITMLNVFQCTPIGALFNYPIPQTAKCTDIVTIYLSSAPLNIITDLAILFLPMPILTGMRLPRKQKIILIITFSFGVFVAAVDVVRIAYLQSAAQTRLAEIENQTNHGGTASRTAENTDFPWYASLSFMWSVIEVNVGIMCACVPALKPLASRFMPHLLRSADDVTEKSSSMSLQGTTTWEMAVAQRIPSVVSEPEIAHRQQFHPEPHEEEGPMGMMDFLTTPDMHEYAGNALDRTQTALTNTTRNTQPNSPTFFDFVNMKGQKSMVQMTVRESIFPIVMVTVLFFIWGFEYGLLDVLNQQFQRVAHMTPGQTSSIHSAYYAGYILGPSLIGWPVLKHWGFKACYSVGLSIYACGTLIFWPAAVLTSYPAYLVTNIIVGTGLSVLEVSANPFIVLCGPPEYAEIRLNFSQGVQAIGTVIAPLIANRAFFHRSFDAPSLVSTQYAYLGIALFTALLALVYHYIPLPEATDSELEDAAERFDGGNKAKFGNIHVIWFILGLAAFSQFFYVGAQEVIGTEFESYLAQVVSPTWSGANYMAIAHTCFAVSRFLAAGLGYYIKPRIQIMFFFAGSVVFTALAMHLDGTTGLAMLMMVFFMEGPLFPLIFAQSLRGMGRHTRLATVVMTSMISSGAVFSPISNHLTNQGLGAQYSLIVAAVVFGIGLIMPIGFSMQEKIRRLVDPLSGYEAADQRPGSTSSRASRALSFLSIGKRPSKDNGAIEFRERTVSAS